MPARACASGEARVRSLPSKTIRPPLGMVSPARQLKNVDLPAPFGPINPMISPSLRARSAPATARNSPNFFDTLVASRSLPASGMAAFPERVAKTGSEPIPQIEQSTRLEPRDQHDDAAVKNVGQARTAAAEPGIGRALQRNQNERADQRPEQGSGAAERGDDNHLHRDQNAEGAVGIDEARLDHVERAGN